ncbi:hypothetical protein LJC60_02850 [Ruminococcaceae bacterium OttesenSCG-928-D13]|nr:hypothetical protein [Ruminococcaceae bacterium OttesenSCG-928-D13]
MKKLIKNRITLKNPSRGLILAVGLLLVALKLFLAHAQRMLLTPEEAVLDDNVMYNAAVSIAGGNWLGDYGPLTLSKYSFFSLWVAVLHFLRIPYLMGGQLLWVAAALAAAWAFAPLFKNRWAQLGLFAVLLFNPASTANPAPQGFVARVYRDNIFPALCLLCIAGMAGFAIRLWEKQSKSTGWLALAGLAFAAAWLCREDGWWMIFFMAGAALVCGWFIVRRKEAAFRDKLKHLVALLLPFALLAGGILGWRGANQARYGRFILDDFATGEFADAYGAMTRIDHENWNPKVAVPREVRQKLYALVPAFAELEPLLEGEKYLTYYGGLEEGAPLESADYDSGSFYWALRLAAAELGYYDSPQASQAYFEGLARAINALCDDGTLAAGPRRSGVSPPIRAEYIAPVTAEALYSLAFCAVFAQCDARSLWSTHANDPVFYAETIAPMEAFLHDTAQTATEAGSEAPYHSLSQRLRFLALDIIRYVYAALTPLALLAALAWQLLEGARLAKLLRRREPTGKAGLLWVLCLGLWLCILLRAFMIAFVTVASFHIGTFVMYLATIHPMMLLVGYIGAARLIGLMAARRRAKKAAPGALDCGVMGDA